MRAETEGNIEAIRRSLNLLAQRMDWETAPHRLEEFDALIEAPDLWNDPAKAQKLMRERQALLESTSLPDRASTLTALMTFAQGATGSGDTTLQ